MNRVESYLKKHAEALVKDVGIEAACALSGRSKATLGGTIRRHPSMRDGSCLSMWWPPLRARHAFPM